MEEKELVKASQSGDDKAFSLLVGKYTKKVFNMALSVTRNHQVADDLTQEVFIKTYLSLPRFKHKSEFGTWLYRIASNHIKDFLRKKNRVREISLEAVKEPSVNHEEELLAEEKKSEEEQRRKILHSLIDKLPEKQKLILTLRDIQGFSYQEISKILHISVGTVDSRLFRARKKLRGNYFSYLRKKGGKNEL